ncbi:MAG: hypothetical protein C5S45_01610 [Candidatus Methanocomedens sp.]|nr:MAG: hypothetical protein C5S45_01610 [ANME-2 cluster archaeon]
MEKKSPTRKSKTLLTHQTWLGILVASVVLFATCYEFTTVDQPVEGYTNSTFSVPIVIKQSEHAGDNFEYHHDDKGCFGILLPEGWTVDDNIPFNVKGIYANEPVGPIDDNGLIQFDETYSQMYEDSAAVDYEGRAFDNPKGWQDANNQTKNYDTPDGYYWWGGVTDTVVSVDYLDSITLTITINTDDQTGEFELRYAMGTLDSWMRNPVVEGGLSDLVAITITESTNVEEYLQREISVYPNPATDMLNINVGGVREGEIQIIDITGKVHMERTLTSKVNRFDVSTYSPGLYIMKVRTDAGEYSQKVLIRRYY